MPTEYFSLDRRGFYKVGETLDLFKQNPLTNSPLLAVPNLVMPEELQKHLEELFPDGLSLHGWTYMTWYTDFVHSQGAKYSNYDVTLELVLEYVRRSTFADRPSRLQSYFAFTSLEEAIAFRLNNGATAISQPIYRLHADRIMQADQEWLKLGNQNAIGSLCARKFWSGTASPNPKWEYMLVPPVHVLEQVQK
jgi:hypothetical protein